LFLCSTNGTFINWKKFTKKSPPARLNHGDIISFTTPPHNGEMTCLIRFQYSDSYWFYMGIWYPLARTCYVLSFFLFYNSILRVSLCSFLADLLLHTLFCCYCRGSGFSCMHYHCFNFMEVILSFDVHLTCILIL
jgi:hypothetical protein